MRYDSDGDLLVDSNMLQTPANAEFANGTISASGSNILLVPGQTGKSIVLIAEAYQGEGVAGPTTLLLLDDFGIKRQLRISADGAGTDRVYPASTKVKLELGSAYYANLSNAEPVIYSIAYYYE